MKKLILFALILLQNNVTNTFQAELNHTINQVKEEIEDACAICLDVLGNDQKNYKLSCNHTFHHECIDSWIKDNPSCPICRKSIDQQEYSRFNVSLKTLKEDKWNVTVKSNRIKISKDNKLFNLNDLISFDGLDGKISKLDLSKLNLKKLPFLQETFIKDLNVSNNPHINIAKRLPLSLQKLTMRNCKLLHIPNNISDSLIIILDVSNNKGIRIDQNSLPTTLEKLFIRDCDLTEIPDLSQCNSLTEINVSNNLGISIDPKKMPPNLETLDISSCGPQTNVQAQKIKNINIRR